MFQCKKMEYLVYWAKLIGISKCCITNIEAYVKNNKYTCIFSDGINIFSIIIASIQRF